MSEHSRAVTIGFFIIRFAAFAAICLSVWWSFLFPYYAGAVGQVCARTLIILGEPIVAVSVNVDETGVLKEITNIVFHMPENATRELADVGRLMHSLPPFIILVLATAGLGLRRRLKIMAIGTAIFVVGHVSWIVIGYKIGAMTETLKAYGQFWLTVPLLLWIALAYRDKVMAFFDDAEEASEDGEEEPKTEE